MAANDRSSETQQDFFEALSDEPKRPDRFPELRKNAKPILISTTLEQALFAAILIILFGCAAFFLGVLRGRSLGAGKPAPPRVTVVSSSVRTAVPPVRVPAAAAVGAQTVRPVNAAPIPPPTTVKPYTIQIASVKSAKEAEAQALALRRQGYMAMTAKSGTYTIITVGQYSSRAEAEKDLAALSTRFKKPFLRRR